MQHALIAELVEKELSPIADNIKVILAENDLLRAENAVLKQAIAGSEPVKKEISPLTDNQLESILGRAGISQRATKAEKHLESRSSEDVALDKILDSILTN